MYCSRSKHIFEKYRKRGYRVVTKVVSNFKMVDHLTGWNYWNQQQMMHCTIGKAANFHKRDVRVFDAALLSLFLSPPTITEDL
jgi:hypothetical protein